MIETSTVLFSEFTRFFLYVQVRVWARTERVIEKREGKPLDILWRLSSLTPGEVYSGAAAAPEPTETLTGASQAGKPGEEPIERAAFRNVVWNLLVGWSVRCNTPLGSKPTQQPFALGCKEHAPRLVAGHLSPYLDAITLCIECSVEIST